MWGCWLHNEYQPFDLTGRSGNRPTVFQTPTMMVGNGGRYMACNATVGSSVSCGGLDTGRNFSGAGTILSVAFKSAATASGSTNGANVPIIMSNYPGAGSNASGFELEMGNGFLGSPNAITFANQAGGTFKIYVNGTLTATQTINTTNFKIYAMAVAGTFQSSSSLKLGYWNGSTDTYGVNGGLLLSVAWERVLPDALLKMISTNPFGLLEYPNDDIFALMVAQAAAGARQPFLISW